MALLFCDSFDHYATADFLAKYDGLANSGGGAVIDPTGGRHGSGAFRTTAGYGVEIYLPQTNTVIVGFAWKTDSTLGASIVGLNSTGASELLGIESRTDGRLSVWNGSSFGSPTKLGSTRASLVTTGAWYYIEFKVYMHATAGTVEIRVNGTSELSLTGVNTLPTGGNGFVRGVYLYAYYAVTYYDDFYVLDPSGARNNDFLGDVRADAHFPMAPDGAHHDWTPSAGSDNYATVDEAAPNTTDYNRTATLNAIDTLNIEDLKPPSGTILAVQVLACHIKEDAGACTLAPVVRSGGADYVEADVSPSSAAYKYARAIRELNPNGDAAWARASFNALEAGYKLTTAGSTARITQLVVETLTAPWTPYWKDIANHEAVALRAADFPDGAHVNADLWAGEAGVTIQTRLWNQTDGVSMGESEVVTGTTPTSKKIPITLTAELAEYKMQATSDTPGVDLFAVPDLVGGP